MIVFWMFNCSWFPTVIVGLKRGTNWNKSSPKLSSLKRAVNRGRQCKCWSPDQQIGVNEAKQSEFNCSSVLQASAQWCGRVSGWTGGSWDAVLQLLLPTGHSPLGPVCDPLWSWWMALSAQQDHPALTHPRAQVHTEAIVEAPDRKSRRRRQREEQKEMLEVTAWLK